MANIFREKRRGEMMLYARPNLASYENKDGDIVVAETNVPRYEYVDGYLHGLKMGDGDTLSLPLTENRYWPAEQGVIVATYNAPNDQPFVVCGDVELSGYGALKTVILHLEDEALAPSVTVGAGTVEADENAHFLIFKYYGQDPDIESTTEYEAMTEMNSFLHGSWH